LQGGEDSTTQGGREDQSPADVPADVAADVPGDAAPVRLGRSRAWTRPALSGAAANSGATGKDVPAEETAPGPAQESTVAAPPVSPPGQTMELSPIFRNWSDPAASANTPERCHFLRGITDNGRLVDPQPEANATHRCAAFGEPLPLSLRQQELVCLQRVHVSCPRYLRGALLASESAAEPETVRTRSGISLTVAAGLVLILVVALIGGAGLSGFLPGLGSGSSPTSAYVALSNSPSGTATATSSAAVATSSLTPAPTATASASPTPSPTPSVAPSPTPWPACPPGAKGGRLTCLVPCPDQTKCYEYMIHAGDKLNEIAFYFGVTMNSIWAMNPWLKGSTKITLGEILRLPPPTK